MLKHFNSQLSSYVTTFSRLSENKCRSLRSYHITTVNLNITHQPAMTFVFSSRRGRQERCDPRMEGSGWQGGAEPPGSQVYEVAVVQNATAPHSHPFADVALLQTFKPLIIPCYVLVVLVGVFGNYLLIYVICRSKKMHNVTNLFIGNLAFSDMLMCVTCVPFTLAYAFSPHGWTFGRFMCYLVFLIQPVTVYVSVFTLTAIAVDRWVQAPDLLMITPLRDADIKAKCVWSGSDHLRWKGLQRMRFKWWFFWKWYRLVYVEGLWRSLGLA